MARRYSKKASTDVGRAMKKRKAGTLKSGRSGRKVKSRKQAIAIGLSEARAKTEDEEESEEVKAEGEAVGALAHRTPSCPGRSAKRVFALDVPGIHVLCGAKEERRGWPGQARP